MTVRSMGVEEELLLVEPGTGRPLAAAAAAAGAGARVAALATSPEPVEPELTRKGR